MWENYPQPQPTGILTTSSAISEDDARRALESCSDGLMVLSEGWDYRPAPDTDWISFTCANCGADKHWRGFCYPGQWAAFAAVMTLFIVAIALVGVFA